MSKDKLKPGDIVKHDANAQLGMVMRDDEISGFLVAYPEFDELTCEHKENVKRIGNIKQIERARRK